MRKKKLLTLIGGISLILVLAVMPFSAACPAPPAEEEAPPAEEEWPVTPTGEPYSYGSPEWDKVVAAAKAEGEINAYGYGFTGDRGKLLEDTFCKEYGIKINPVSALSGQLYERIKTEMAVDKVVADLLNITPRWTLVCQQDGMFIETASQLPELKATKADDWVLPMILAEGQIVSASGVPMGMAINTKLVPPEEEPTSWYDLLDPKWKGKIVFESPSMGGTPYLMWQAMPKMGIDREDYFRKLGENEPIIESNVFTAYDAVKEGRAAVMFLGGTDVASEFFAGGAPIKWINTKEGCVWQPGGNYSRIKGGPHPNASLLFINWSLTVEGQKAVGEGYHGLMPRAGIGPYYNPGAVPDGIPKLWTLSYEEQLEMDALQASGIMDKLLGVPVLR